MTRHDFLLPVVTILLAAVAVAGERVIEPRSFTIEKEISATVLPDDGGIPIGLAPRMWQDFRIVSIAPHGSKVAKGDVLMAFDSREIERKRVDARQAREAAQLALAQAEQDLAHLVATSSNKLDALRHAAEVAREERAYFKQTRRKADEESAAQALERRKQMLSNQQEELRQLQKMYEADDLTEETEEIILVRQRDSVRAAEFALRMEELDYKRVIDVRLPREAVTLANAERDSAIALKQAEEEIPRAIARKKLEVASLGTSLERAKEQLADLDHDRALCEIKASHEGWFLHGTIEHGRWVTGDAVKALVQGGRPVADRALATLVPAAASWVMVALLDDATARAFPPTLAGRASLVGREDVEIAVKLVSLRAVPEIDGLRQARFSVAWDEDAPASFAAGARIRAVVYHRESAVVVPSGALKFGPSGWSAGVKMADGKSQERPVRRGRVHEGETEILSGLEAGQVIIVPDK